MNNSIDSYVLRARGLRKDHGRDASLVRAVDGVDVRVRQMRDDQHRPGRPAPAGRQAHAREVIPDQVPLPVCGH
ncbi:MAG: hypothetical protein ACRDPD_28970 [Streptosporangiaceae bacterium]